MSKRNDQITVKELKEMNIHDLVRIHIKLENLTLNNTEKGPDIRKREKDILIDSVSLENPTQLINHSLYIYIYAHAYKKRYRGYGGKYRGICIILCLHCRRPGFSPWVGKIPWRRERLPTPGFIPWTEEPSKLLPPKLQSWTPLRD